MKETVLITGASSGIGEATAILLAEKGYRLILTGRRKKKLDALKLKLSGHTECITLCFDITDKAGMQSALLSLPAIWKDVDILINNAGLALGLGPINEGEWSDWDTMINTNIKGLLYITRLISPRMVSRKKGHIINISSIAGKEVYQNGNVYCATKHAVDALSKAMRSDLLEHCIKVTNIAPGMVETEFSLVRFKGDTNRAKKVYDNIKPLSGKDIADTILFVITRPAHVNINDILVMPSSQANANQAVRKTK
jgi:3-hydroxy acid dehydrogenase / malonic semialdehyde reductase